MRRFVLWLTGRDLLVPELPQSLPGIVSLWRPSAPLWEMRLAGGADGLIFTLPRGPNALHRAAQRLVLGIHWRMLPGSSGGSD